MNFISTHPTYKNKENQVTIAAPGNIRQPNSQSKTATPRQTDEQRGTIQTSGNEQGIVRREGVKRKLDYYQQSSNGTSNDTVLTELLPVTNGRYSQPPYMEHEYHEFSILQFDELHKLPKRNFAVIILFTFSYVPLGEQIIERRGFKIAVSNFKFEPGSRCQ